MLWQTKKIYRKYYKMNDRRLIKCFALFPTWIPEIETTVWLQQYWALQHFCPDGRMRYTASGSYIDRTLVWKDEELFLTLAPLKAKIRKERLQYKQNLDNVNKFLNRMKRNED